MSISTVYDQQQTSCVQIGCKYICLECAAVQ
jgi:hypothetical protein